MGISVQTSGIKVEQGKHYLVNLNADPSLNELLVYYLKVWCGLRCDLRYHIGLVIICSLYTELHWLVVSEWIVYKPNRHDVRLHARPRSTVPGGFSPTSLRHLISSLEIICRSYSVFGLPDACVCVSVRDHILKVCEHDVLQTARGNFAKFTTLAQWGQRWTD